MFAIPSSTTFLKGNRGKVGYMNCHNLTWLAFANDFPNQLQKQIQAMIPTLDERLLLAILYMDRLVENVQYGLTNLSLKSLPSPLKACLGTRDATSLGCEY